MARHPDIPGTPRSGNLNIRITEDDLQVLKQRASGANMSVSEYVRHRALTDTPVAFVDLAHVSEHLTGLHNAILQAQQALSNTTPTGDQ